MSHPLTHHINTPLNTQQHVDRCLWKINDIDINNVSDVARVLGGG